MERNGYTESFSQIQRLIDSVNFSRGYSSTLCGRKGDDAYAKIKAKKEV
jgi:hypothetical protein